MHYLDYAATTHVTPQVAKTIQEITLRYFANPSSLYTPGLRAQDIIEESRQTLANAMGAGVQGGLRTPTLLFTGSGTEGNNLAILGAARARKNWGSHIVATGYEHPSADKTVRYLAEKEGFSLTLVPPGEDGRIDPTALVQAVTAKTVLVCAMQVNNETGAVLDVAALAEDIKRKNSRTAVHVDGVQGFTKIPIDLQRTAIDSYAVSAHKIHGPKGVGALYLRKGFHVEPVLHGGGQEGGLRPGTENTAYIAAFAQAAQIALQNREADAKQVARLHARLVQGLQRLEGIVFNSPEGAFAGIVNISLPPQLRSEVMLHHLESYDVYISSGSACAKGEPSHTLTAMGLPPARVDAALRISLAGGNTDEDVDALLEGLQSGLKTLLRGRPQG